MKPTIKERKQALYDATTKARTHYLATEKRVMERVKKQHPELEWWEQSDIVYNDKEVIEAGARLSALCDACRLIGIEIGE